jgi:hypothetical protein
VPPRALDRPGAATRPGLGPPVAAPVRQPSAHAVPYGLPAHADDREQTFEDDRLEDLLRIAFRDAVQTTRADMGLLNRRQEAFFCTTAVHGLDPQYHMQVGVSMWDPVVAQALQGRTVSGACEDSVETCTLARRLEKGALPGYVLAIPVVLRHSVVAVVELGRMRAAFEKGIERVATESIHELVH